MFEAELKSLGLTEKESLVYLAMLELGPAAMLDIARRSGVNRATAYVATGSLITKGLASSFERGKKTFFTAEDPDRLRSLFAIQKKAIEEQERHFDAALPRLRELMMAGDDRPRVRFYEGKEGLRAIQEDILRTESTSLEEMSSLDAMYKLFPPHKGDHRDLMRRRFAGINVRVLYTSSNGPIEAPQGYPQMQFKYLPIERFPFRSDIILYGPNKVALHGVRDKIFGVLIESQELAESLRALFDFMWVNIADAKN